MLIVFTFIKNKSSSSEEREGNELGFRSFLSPAAGTRSYLTRVQNPWDDSNHQCLLLCFLPTFSEREQWGKLGIQIKLMPPTTLKKPRFSSAIHIIPLAHHTTFWKRAVGFNRLVFKGLRILKFHSNYFIFKLCYTEFRIHIAL